MSFPISDVLRRVVYSGSAGVGPYSFSFEILAATDIEVYKNSTLLTLTTDYTVTISGSGTGSVTLVVAATGADNITLVGARAIERTTDFVTGGDLFANTLNQELDSVVIFAQQVDEKADRGLKAPITDPTDINMQLPVKASRRGKVLAFDETSGDPVAGPDLSAMTTVIAQSANINTVAANIASVNTVAGNTSNVNTVAGISGNVTTVAGVAANVTTVAGISANVTSVAGNATNINAVAGNATNINAVAGNATNINAVAADAADIGTVAGSIANVNAVATNIAAVVAVDGNETNINAVNSNATNINTVAGIAANVTTVAGIAANVTTVAGVSANVTTVAGISADVTAVATNNANVSTVATNIANVNTVASDIAAIITTANDLNEAVSEIEVVANNIASVDTVGDNIANVNTVAGISADVSTVAADSADIQLLADNIATINEKLNADNPSYTGTLTGGTGVVNLGSGQVYKDASGNVGIGTSSPSFPLDVAGAIRGNSWIGRANTSAPTADAFIFRPADNTLGLGTGNTERLRIDSAGNVGIGTSSPDPFGRSDNRNLAVVATTAGHSAAISVSAGAGSGRGGQIYLGVDSTRHFEISGNGGESTLGTISNTPLRFTTNNAERMRITSGGVVCFGTTNTDPYANNVAGISFGLVTGLAVFSRDSGDVLAINRKTNDGNLVVFGQDSITEGSISVSGSTVSYNGGHLSRWAQTTTAKDESLVKGTVLSNLDEMNIYTNAEGNPVQNEQLNKVKVSDVEGDANVAGVFVNWTHDEAHDVDEINMAMTGDMIIRIAEGVTVARGDLLMSAGDGTAKPQGDDIVRSKTIAKVTSTHVTCTYADGSFCVPCVLMAC